MNTHLIISKILPSFFICFLMGNSGLFGMQLEPDSSTFSIYLHSTPDSVAVFNNSILLGITPCKIKGKKNESTLLVFKKEGYLNNKLNILSKSDTSILVCLYKPAMLTITSVPESVEVFISNRRIGFTPLELKELPLDTLEITMNAPKHESWKSVIVPIEGSNTPIIARLKKIETSISVLVDPPNTSIFLDGKFISKGSIYNYLTISGTHEIIIQNDSIGRRTKLLTTTEESLRHFYLGDLGIQSFKRGLLTVIIPGSAQIIDGSYVEGSLVFVGSLVLGYNMLNSQREYNERLSEYDFSIWNYGLASTEQAAQQWHDVVLKRKSDLDTYYTRREISIYAFAACYAYGLIDAILNHLVTDDLRFVPWRELRTAPGLFSPVATTGVKVKIGL